MTLRKIAVPAMVLCVGMALSACQTAQEVAAANAVEDAPVPTFAETANKLAKQACDAGVPEDSIQATGDYHLVCKPVGEMEKVDIVPRTEQQCSEFATTFNDPEQHYATFSCRQF